MQGRVMAEMDLPQMYILRRKETKDGEKCLILVRDGSGMVKHLEPTRMGLHASPDGFEWGYSGSGPWSTAHAILSSRLKAEASPKMTSKFKATVVARVDQEGGTMSGEGVDKWIGAYADQYGYFALYAQEIKT